MKIKFVSLILFAAIIATMFVSCIASTKVAFNTNDVTGAAVYVDGEFIGKTPTTPIKMSNGFGMSQIL